MVSQIPSPHSFQDPDNPISDRNSLTIETIQFLSNQLLKSEHQLKHEGNHQQTLLTSSNDLRTSPNTRTDTGTDTTFGYVVPGFLESYVNATLVISIYTYIISYIQYMYRYNKSPMYFLPVTWGEVSNLPYQPQNVFAN